MTEIIQDTISLSLSAEHTVTNKTVKMTALINALVTNTTEEALREEIRTTMKSFIDADWTFSNMARSNDPTGFERVELAATARVPDTEHYNLEKRSEAVSRPGLSIVSVTVDSTIPERIIEAAEKELRLKLIEKVQAEAEALSEALGQQYRVSQLQFAGTRNVNISNTHYNVATYYSGNAIGASAAGGAPPSDSLGNTSKLTLSANVVLARIHAMPSTHNILWTRS